MLNGTPLPAEAQIRDIAWSFARTMVLRTAVELDVVDLVAQGHDTMASLCRATRASARGLRPLVDALVGLGLLRGDGEKLRPTPLGEAFLVEGAPADHRPFIRHMGGIIENWLHLTDCVRSGSPYRSASPEQKARDVFPALADALYGVNRPAARELAEIATARRPAARVLDVAAGSGIWGIEIARADPDSRVVAHDFPEVLEVTRRHVVASGLEDRFEYLAGSLAKTDLGEERHDIVVLGHILHSEGAEGAAELVGRCTRALAPRGLLVVAEMIPSDERDGPLHSLLFGLNMLVHTTTGDVFTAGQYREWLEGAGLQGIEFLETAGGTQVVLAEKP